MFDHQSDKRVSSADRDPLSGECLVTQCEHPVLKRPFFMVHPCKTSEMMGELKEFSSVQSNDSAAHVYLNLWISTYLLLLGISLN